MKNTIKLLLASVLMVLASALPSAAQTALTATTLASAITSSSGKIIVVSSATGITAPASAAAPFTSPTATVLFVDNEEMFVQAINSTTITVIRGYNSTKANPHVSGAMVLAGPPQAFVVYDPSGACTNGQGVFLYSPVVNVRTGNQWLCSTVTGKVVPGFQNDSASPQVTTAVASAAGKVTPSGPLFHITGTSAITGFNIPVGFDPKAGSTVCAIPDGLFTTTNANNFALASTAVVSKTLCWTYDGNTAKFYPSY